MEGRNLGKDAEEKILFEDDEVMGNLGKDEGKKFR